MNRKLYVLDDSSISYVRMRRSLRTRLLEAGFAVFGAALLAVCLLLFTTAVPKLEQYFLLAEQDYLLQKVETRGAELAAVNQRLEKMHETEQSLYRSILDLPVVDPGLWDGGVGGDLRQAPALDPEASRVEKLETQLAYRLKLKYKHFDELFARAEEKKDELNEIPVLLPASGRLTSGFGYRNHPIRGEVHMHTGLDVSLPVGSPIYAATDGTVVEVERSRGGYGYQILLRHGPKYATRYAHLSGFNVEMGQKVKRGDVIGYSGNTGNSTGPHLHYEVLKNGAHVNPASYCLVRPGQQ